MTREDQVLALFAEANPVSDPSTLVIDPATLARLETIEQWSADMEDTNVRAIEPVAPAPNRRSWLIAAAVAAVVLVAGVGAWVLLGGDQEPVAAPEAAIVASAYDALNRGDLAAYLDSLTRGNEMVEERRSLAAILINANHRTELVEPCTLLGPGPTGLERVECSVIRTNDWQDAAGITITQTELWVIDGNGKIALAENDGDFSRLVAFNEDFWDWLQTAHPAVYAEIKPASPGGHSNLPGFDRDAAHMLIALEYVDEFVEDSPDWPR